MNLNIRKTLFGKRLWRQYFVLAWGVFFLWTGPFSRWSAPTVDLSKYDAKGDVQVSHPEPNTLVARWRDKAGALYRVRFNLAAGQPLLQSLESASNATAPFRGVARNVDVRYRVTLGARRQQAGWPYIFFDKVYENKPEPGAHLSVLDLKAVLVASESRHRVKIVFSTLSFGRYSGELTCYIYAGSPFLHIQASMLVDQPWVAYIYDALLYAEFERISYKDNTTRQLTTVEPSSLEQSEPGEPAGVKAMHRAIMGSVRGGDGTLAMVAPPHAGLYPLDRSDNYGFLQAGKTFIGTKMSFWGDRGYVPWVEALQGATQRMDAFVVISRAGPQDTLARVLAYTHGDVFKAIPGYYTMAEHFHPEIAQAKLDGQDALTPFKQTMKSIGVQIVQPMEFHLGKGQMHPVDNTDQRLAELRTMYTLFREQSDENFLLIPGEEYNEFFGGHWSYMFPRPVYFTGWRGQQGKKFRETNVASGGQIYPVVYQVGNAENMLELLRKEGGIAWASHPRIKDSQQTPDSFVDSDYYRDERFHAGDWKAMPLDLSKNRLGGRAFQLMDDTAQWGYRKYMLGAVDTFELDATHEIYGNMNVNYLELAAFPRSDDWSSVVECIRRGRFFTTTGELLIRKWTATAAGVTADVEWYFPPSFAEVIWGDAQGVHRRKRSLADQVEFGRQTLTIPVDLKTANWVRFEIWDVARNGVFTQPFWLRTPPNPAVVTGAVTGFTLIDTNTDSPVPGYDPIPAEAVLDRSKLPAHLTIRANTSPLVVEQVNMSLDGVGEVRNRWPYCWTNCVVKRGIRGSPFYDYMPSEFGVGSHLLIATPFRGETSGTPLTLSFSVK